MTTREPRRARSRLLTTKPLLDPTYGYTPTILDPMTLRDIPEARPQHNVVATSGTSYTCTICLKLAILDPAQIGKKKEGHLHRAIIDGDMSKIFSLVKQRPSLNPALILAMMGCYADMRSHPEGKNATPLLAAIHMGTIEMCRYLIEERADVNWGYLNGMGPLFLALHHKHYEIAELLIESGANVHDKDRLGRAPLHYAIEEDSPVSIVKTILSAGFPKDGVIFDNAIIKSIPLTRAISVKNVPVVKFLLEQNVDVNLLTVEGTTPLIIAISHMSPEIVKLLIEHGANVEGLNMNDAPPLFLAVQTEDTTMLKILIDAGVNVNRIFTPMDYVHSILLIPYVTAFQLAAMSCNLPATKELLNHGADINAKNPLINSTALHIVFAIHPDVLNKRQKNIHRKIIQYLLENGADTNVKDNEGKLPIQNTFISKNWIALEEYIKFGANLNKPVSPRDGSILRFAICNKVDDYLIELCLAYGADCFQKFHGNPIYNDVMRSNRPNILRLFWKYAYPVDDVPTEKSFKNNPRVLSLLNTQLLFTRSITSNDPDPESVKRALKQGAEVNCQSNHLLGFPLHICSYRGDTELVQILLEAGATISTLNSAGFTALHVAAKAGHLDICKLLLRHGACLNGRGPGGTTPCQLAQLGGHTKLVNFFKSVSRRFSLLKNKNAKIVDEIKKKLGSEEFHVFMNCVNNRGNTLLGEALRLNLKVIGENLMSLRLKQSKLVTV